MLSLHSITVLLIFFLSLKGEVLHWYPSCVPLLYSSTHNAEGCGLRAESRGLRAVGWGLWAEGCGKVRIIHNIHLVIFFHSDVIFASFLIKRRNLQKVIVHIKWFLKKLWLNYIFLHRLNYTICVLSELLVQLSLEPGQGRQNLLV